MNDPNPVPAAPQPVTAGAIVWYRSPIYLSAMATVLGAFVALYPKAAAAMNIHTSDDLKEWAQLIGGVVTLGAGAFTALKRQSAAVQPLALTRASAAAHPATLAVVQTQEAMRAAGIPTAVQLQATLTNRSNNSEKSA